MNASELTCQDDDSRREDVRPTKLFGLDFLETRRLVGDAQMRGFTFAGLKTAGFGAWFAVMLIWVGVRSFQASVKPDEADARARDERQHPVEHAETGAVIGGEV